MGGERSRLVLPLLIGGFCVAALWAGYAAVMVFAVHKPWEVKAQWGESFDALSALFAGFAFVGLLVTIYLQKQEITRLAYEQRESAQLLNEQVKALRITAKLNYLTDRIAFTRKLLQEDPDKGDWSNVNWRNSTNQELSELKKERERLVKELTC